MRTAKAFAPGNLSCIFSVCRHKDPEKMGSLGLGCSTKDGALVEVSESEKTDVFYNNKKVHFPTVLSVITALTNKKVKVRIKSKLPLGAGFGMSGASALAAAYALNRLLGLKKSKVELAMKAHIAEVINNTGLGDVGGQFNGLGFMLKAKKYHVLNAESLNIKDIFLYYRVFGPLETKKVIKGNANMIKRINKACLRALNKVKRIKNTRNKNEKLSGIIRISKEFAVKSGLLKLAKNKEMERLIKSIEKRKGAASMIMLGNAMFSNIPFRGCKKTKVVKNEAKAL